MGVRVAMVSCASYGSACARRCGCLDLFGLGVKGAPMDFLAAFITLARMQIALFHFSCFSLFLGSSDQGIYSSN